MRVCAVGSLLLGLLLSALPPSHGLDGDRKVGDDEVYKPRKWSQVRDGPYRMVVSSRDQDSGEGEENTDKSPEELLEENTKDGSKEKEEVDESSVPPEESFEKSTPRAMLKLARKRERILSSESIRKPLRNSHDTVSTTPNPNTMSYKIYNHFRPLEQGVPRESIIPFLDFGKKLSTGRTPSGMNSIEGSSTPGLAGLGVTTEREDEDLFHEDMDVSVVKLKAVERNTVPRVRAPSRNPGITAYFRKRNPTRNAEALVASNPNTTNLPLKVEVTTTKPTTVPTTTTITTTLPTTTRTTTQSTTKLTTLSSTTKSTTTQVANITVSTPTETDLLSNESKTKVHVMPPPRPRSTTENSSSSTASFTPSPPQDVTPISIDRNSTSIYPNSTLTTQLPKPSPTAKILSTAVVTSISVKETYRHPRIKSSLLAYEALKTNISEPARNNQTDNVPKTSTTAIPSETPVNTSEVTRSTEHPSISSARPKYKSNLEYHASFTTTKVPTTSTTHKPLNRSLYSTHQREYKSKLLSHQHNKPDNSSKTSETPSFKSDVRNSNLNENKTKMYLTIRSRLSNQTATYRSTFRRNGTKPIPPVLRVIATPSSYIEVPKLPSRIFQRNSTTSTTTESPSWTTIPGVSEVHKNSETQKENLHSDPITEVNTAVSESEEVVVQKVAKEEKISPKFISVVSSEVKSEQESVSERTEDLTTQAEYTTLVEFKPLETSTSGSTPDLNATMKSVTFSATSPNNPGLSWVFIGQKNLSVTKVPSDGVEVTNNLGIATYVLAALGVIPLILGGFILVRQIILKSKKKMLDESEYSSEYNRTPLPAKLPRIPSHVNWEGEKGASSSAPAAPAVPPPPLPPSLPVTKWEFPRDKLRLQTLLGEGNFGQVWKAEADDISGHEGLTRLVAVKTVKEGSSTKEREDLLRELGIMQDLGSHPNVVTLLGCCTDREPYLLIMEYVMYGKMLTFLREHRTKAHYFNFSDLSSALTSRDLTVFAYCVARGMEYIVSKGIIHRDLAARNILVDHNKLCKIADFGMSRNVRDTGEIYEQRPNRGALPIRWMAPEALHYSLFTHKSDVWSFGILVWEIITLGSTPYSTMGAREVMRRVREGYRLDRPIHCRQELYRVITRCWISDPNKRPTFTELKHDLATLLGDPNTNGAYVDLDALTEEMSSHSC